MTTDVGETTDAMVNTPLFADVAAPVIVKTLVAAVVGTPDKPVTAEKPFTGAPMEAAAPVVPGTTVKYKTRYADSFV